jgi:hypothetical protein
MRSIYLLNGFFIIMIAFSCTSNINHPADRAKLSEAERLELNATEVRGLILKEIEEREAAAAEFERLGMDGKAEGLRADALLARRYVAAEELSPSDKAP